MNVRTTAAIVVLVVALAGGAFAYDRGLVGPTPDDYDRTSVTVVDENGTELATVEVRIADTSRKRYVGLSDTDSLATNEGMLFVHDTEATHAYVMRDMDFPLDIMFVDANGTITQIHHAPLPPAGTDNQNLTRYRGTGKYVLEVQHGYTTAHDITVGDRVDVGAS